MASPETGSVDCLERAINRAMFACVFAGLAGIAHHVGAETIAVVNFVNACAATLFSVVWGLRAKRPSEAR